MTSCVDSLTEAERQIVELAALGLSNPELARRRCCSRATVVNQLGAAYKKLGVTSRRELCALAISQPAGPSPELPLTLSPREREVLSAALGGQSNKCIAYALGIALSSVSTTLTRARRKLRCTVGLP